MDRVKVGIIGCGNISKAYCTGIAKFPILNLVACADIDIQRAEACAKEYQIPKACSVEALLDDPEIEIVVNLTIPKAHFEVCKAVLEANKHVYVEKPFCVRQEDGEELLRLAKAKGKRIGCAPDTFLGGGIQTARKLIDDGWIGQPVAATAFMMGRGHEFWHPNPAFYYDVGGGPMFDMGPYYLTALVVLMGPFQRITGSTRITYPERTITSQPKSGQKIQVQTPTHIAGVIDFQCGAVATLITSFDIFGGTSPFPNIEIYGSRATLRVPDPNTFDGPVMVKRQCDTEFSAIPLTHGFTEQGRGLGVADMAYAIRSDRPHRANGELAYHVLEAMHGFHRSSDSGRHHEMTSTCDVPVPFPLGMSYTKLDAS